MRFAVAQLLAAKGVPLSGATETGRRAAAVRCCLRHARLAVVRSTPAARSTSDVVYSFLINRTTCTPSVVSDD
jgi:hypothetical protein